VDAIAQESYGGLSDTQIVDLCLGRDQLAWAQVVTRFRRRVFNIAYKFTGRHGDAEDLTQDIFLRVFRSLDKFNRGANFGTWLTSVARNHCIDHYRATKREREVLVTDLAHFDNAAATSANPQHLVEARDRTGLVRRALDRLPAKLREAVVLRDLTELSYQEMARQLGLPEGTVKSRINRGRAELARILLRARQDARRASSEETRTRSRKER
jgi:RNA polymerase sigma-70 factor (ECF subfamily)